ncbi:exoribonuclease [Theileria orientalis]|uniref:Exoribonuclease n=1 Tax=Theileria orientalis TaxID=68886 RepID=A0A976QRP3_THEOR|nr:exoribonuclease [Theileria orientalis]
MGVPTFYRWLCNRYPRVPKDLVDNYNDRELDLLDEDQVGLDLLSPNPNGEFDNLYLDMNGIIHPCCHPENMEQPESEEIMFKCILEYIDRIFYLVRPRKLIYLAIDGVAPRAKINQQRSRRFKSAALADLEDETYEKMLKEYLEKRNDMEIPVRKNKWDSNVITPGTEFMYKLSNKIVEYIKDRVEKYDAWRRIVVIFSDSNVPGEGEHKIMEFIRSQRHCPGYDPNTKHVLHGMDADLIMLGLTTHEPNFYIIREIVTFYVHPSNKNVPNELEEKAEGKVGLAPKVDTLTKEEKYMKMMRENWKPLQLLQLSVLREYLSHQLKFVTGFDNGSHIEFERCVDDLVLMIFFCGNDFLPNLPSISITGGSIDQMILLYQKLLPSLNDYLSNEGNLNFHSISTFFHYLSKIENETFKQIYEYKRKSEEYHKNKTEGGNNAKYSNKYDVKANANNDKVRKEVKCSFSNGSDASNYVNTAATTTIDDVNAYVTVDVAKVADAVSEVIANTNDAHVANDNNNAATTSNAVNNEVDANTSTKEVTAVTSTDQAKNDSGKQGVVEGENGIVNKKDVEEEFMKRYEEELNKLKSVDEVKLSVDVTLNDPRLWKEAYYREKFHLTEEDDMKAFVQEVSFHYIKGICWVLRYYYQGCPSWSWYYPYHYSPFCSDLEFGTLYSYDQVTDDLSVAVENVSGDGNRDGTVSMVHKADLGSASRTVGDDVAHNETYEDKDSATETDINTLTTADTVTCGNVVDDSTFDNTVLSNEENQEKEPDDAQKKGKKRKKEDMVLIKFDYGMPLTPFQQLMGVMPIRSSHCIPESLRVLMTDPESPLRDFYPVKFQEDPNGKRYKYQWVALLPFIDEEKLLHYVKPIEEQLSEHEKYRNRVSKNIIFLTPQLRMVFINQINKTEKVTDTKYGVKGDELEYYICRCTKKHKSVLLEGVKMPPKVLTIQDLMEEHRNRGFNCEVAKRTILHMLSENRSKRDPFGTNQPEDVLRDTARDYHQYHNQYNPNQYTPTQMNQYGGHYQGNYRGNRHHENYRDNQYYDGQYHSSKYGGNQYQPRQYQGNQYSQNQYQGNYQSGKYGGGQYHRNHHQNQYGSQYRQNNHGNQYRGQQGQYGNQYQGNYRSNKHQENYRDNQYQSNKYHTNKYQNQYGTNGYGSGHYQGNQYGGNQHHQGYQTKYHPNHPDPYGSSSRNHAKHDQDHGNDQYAQSHVSQRYGGQHEQNHYSQHNQHYGKSRHYDVNKSQYQNFRNATNTLKRSANEKYY